MSNRKHGTNGKLDYKKINLTQNEQDYSSGQLDWKMDQPKGGFVLPVRSKKNDA